MKPGHPPVIAAWLLDHLAFTGRNEALTGDLQEEFQQGRSNGWYRRQALSTIAMAIELGPHLLLVWAGLLVYLWFHFRKIYRLSLTRLWHGLLATLPVFVGANVALTLLPFGHLTDARHATVLSLTLDPFFLLTRLPFFFSLLLSIWMALPQPQRNAAAV
jgi:hypothetical protein